MGKGACHAEDRPGARLAAKAGLGAGMGLRQRSLKRLQSVKEDLSALRALWLAPRRLRDSKSHEERLAHYYDKQANTCACARRRRGARSAAPRPAAPCSCMPARGSLARGGASDVRGRARPRAAGLALSPRAPWRAGCWRGAASPFARDRRAAPRL